MAESALRLIQIMKLLPRGYGTTVNEILAKLEGKGVEISERTIQRDLNKLDEAFEGYLDKKLPTNDGLAVGWGFSKDMPGLLPMLDESSALTMVMACKYLKDVLPPSALEDLDPFLTHANEVLDAKNRKGYKKWLKKVAVIPRGQRLTPAKVESKVANEIYRALLGSKQIRATYVNRSGEERVHERIDPLGIVHQGASIYLACRFGDHKEATKTALHRFKEVTVLSSNVKDENFDLNEWINKEFSAHLDSTLEEIALKVRFDDGAAFHLSESPINETQKLTPKGDGSTIVEATVTDTDELRWWLLGFGANVEVISPKPMRRWFKNVVKEMAKNYEK